VTGNTKPSLLSFFIMSIKAQFWCFTLNNPSVEEEEDLMCIIGDRVKFIIWNQEVGSEGTQHLQGYLECGRRILLTTLKRTAGLQRAHLEASKGGFESNMVYCSKDAPLDDGAHLVVLGERVSLGQGCRSDLHQIKTSLDQGVSLSQIANDHFTDFVRYHRGIVAYMNATSTTRDWETEVRVYWGETGSGKTSRAFREASFPYMHPGGMWFDGYCGQDHVIFDDFGGSEFKITYLLKLLDRYPMRVPVKGGFVQWKPRIVWITSNIDPNDWYKSAKSASVKALFRRFTSIERIDVIRPRTEAEESLRTWGSFFSKN